MARKLLFENKPCSRCGGSGQFSYCQTYGSTCFKCHGDGAVLTTRGKAAQLWMDAQRKVATSEVKTGDRVWYDGVFGKTKITVTEITTDANGSISLRGKDDRGEQSGLHGFTEVRRVLTVAELATLRQEALAYQATLTKSGTIRKRGVK